MYYYMFLDRGQDSNVVHVDSSIRTTDIGTHSKLSYYKDDKQLPYYEVIYKTTHRIDYLSYKIINLLQYRIRFSKVYIYIKCGIELGVLCSPKGSKLSNDSSAVLQMATRNRLRGIRSRLSSCKLSKQF